MNESVNIVIMENELSAIDWELNPLAWELYWFVDLFQIVFFKDQPVPIPALTFEKTRVNNLGHYRFEQNDRDLTGHIILNRLYLDRPLWSVLATLLHEMVHAWEFIHVAPEKRTKSWYHSKAFRDKMMESGILCNHNGSHAGLDYKGKFFLTLKQHAVSFNGLHLSSADNSIIPIDTKPKVKGRSKLKKWTCGCQNVRVGKSEFKATCDLCGNRFKLVE